VRRKTKLSSVQFGVDNSQRQQRRQRVHLRRCDVYKATSVKTKATIPKNQGQDRGYDLQGQGQGQGDSHTFPQHCRCRLWTNQHLQSSQLTSLVFTHDHNLEITKANSHGTLVSQRWAIIAKLKRILPKYLARTRPPKARPRPIVTATPSLEESIVTFRFNNCAVWCGLMADGEMVRALDSRLRRSRVRAPAVPLAGNNLGQVVLRTTCSSTRRLTRSSGANCDILNACVSRLHYSD